MELTYIANGKKYIIDQSDNNVIITYSSEGERHTFTLKANVSVTLLDFTVNSVATLCEKDLFFLNGYQSWTDTKEFTINETEKDIKSIPKIITKKFALDKYGDSHIFGYNKKYLHGYDVFYEKGEKECFIYNLNHTKSNLIIRLDKVTQNIDIISDVEGIKLGAGDKIIIADYKVFDDYNNGINDFKKQFNVPVKKIFGYTSWYNYYQNINEQIILRDLEALDSRFELFQIDDGYETFVGDWLDVDKNKFPNGLTDIVKKIKEKGMLAGIWLAPFVAEEKSSLFKNHKNYFVKTQNGYLKCGGNWSGFYALDLSNPDARGYIKKCLTHYMDMGFDFFKLDFLYATNAGLYDGMSRSMATNKYYKFLRECLPGKIILGCGANIINSYGNFDYLRIGPDVSLSFDDTIIMRHLHRERISTKVTLKNTIYRSIFSGAFFGNDPDVFLLRDTNIKLTEKQKEALAIINALFGDVIMTSDNISDYSSKKVELLSKCFDIFKNATDKKFVTNGDIIGIGYTLNNKVYKLKYNTRTGELING